MPMSRIISEIGLGETRDSLTLNVGLFDITLALSSMQKNVRERLK